MKAVTITFDTQHKVEMTYKEYKKMYPNTDFSHMQQPESSTYFRFEPQISIGKTKDMSDFEVIGMLELALFKLKNESKL